MRQCDRKWPDLVIVSSRVIRKGMAFSQDLHNTKRSQPCAELGKDHLGRENSMCKGSGRKKLVNERIEKVIVSGP